MGAKATVTSKGQITLPKDVRDRHGLKPGDSIEFLEENGKTWLRARTLRALDLAGILHRPGMKTLPLEDMGEAIGDAAAADDDRIRREWQESRE